MSGETLPAFGPEPAVSTPWRLSTETANQITHAAGFFAGLVAATVLMIKVWPTGDLLAIIGCTIYAATLIALYAASTLSHSFESPSHREFFRMLDQVCIFLFVVGNFTPFVLVHIRNSWGWSLLALMWCFSLLGCYLRVKSREHTISPWFFMPLGWLPILTIGSIYAVGSWLGLGIVLAGGLAYSGGVWFLMNDHKHPYFHAVWHIATMTGTGLHFLFTLWFVAAPGIHG